MLCQVSCSATDDHLNRATTSGTGGKIWLPAEVTNTRDLKRSNFPVVGLPMTSFVCLLFGTCPSLTSTRELFRAKAIRFQCRIVAKLPKAL